jgi:hypothetical protein
MAQEDSNVNCQQENMDFTWFPSQDKSEGKRNMIKYLNMNTGNCSLAERRVSTILLLLEAHFKIKEML